MAGLRFTLLRWKIEAHAWLESIWENRWSGIVLTGCGVLACGLLLWRVQAPGISVAVMGVAAAIMSARTKATGAEKAAWMLIISALLVIEVLAIKKERMMNEVTQAIRVREERDHFTDIGDGLKAAIAQGQVQFAQTIEQAEQNLNHVTGGKTYPMVTPILIPVAHTTNTFRLTISAVGDSPLFDIDATLSKLPLPTGLVSATDYISGKTPDYLTTLFQAASLSPNRFQMVVPTITLSDSGTTDFLITTLARNGTFHEKLHIKATGNTATRSGGNLVLPWQWSCEVKRDKIGRDKRAHEVIIAKLPWQTFVFVNGQVTQQ